MFQCLARGQNRVSYLGQILYVQHLSQRRSNRLLTTCKVPTEPFPGALIRKTSAAVAPSLPVRSSRPASRPRLNKEWIHDLSEPGPTDRQKAHYVPTRGDFTDRYKGEAYPDFGSGDYYRPSLVKPGQ